MGVLCDLVGLRTPLLCRCAVSNPVKNYSIKGICLQNTYGIVGVGIRHPSPDGIIRAGRAVMKLAKNN